MQKWEYLRLEVSHYQRYYVVSANGQPFPHESQPDLDDYIAMLGEQGWELVVVSREGCTAVIGGWIFKRPKS